MSRLSPIAAYVGDDGRAYDNLDYSNDSDDMYTSYSEDLADAATEEEQASLEANYSTRRGQRRGRSASLSGKKIPPLRKRCKSRTKGRRSKRRSRNVQAQLRISRYSDNESTEDEGAPMRASDNGGLTIEDVSSPNTRTALARSQDLLERARAYLLNRQGLNSNTRRFLEQKERSLVRRSPSKLSRGHHTRRRKKSRRVRPASAGRYHPLREEQFGRGAGRMVAASQGRSSTADYDKFDSKNFKKKCRCLFNTHRP